MQSETISINNLLSNLVQLSSCQLEWRGTPIEARTIFDNSHLMPVVTIHASVMAMHLLGWDLDVENRPSKEGLLGIASTIPNLNKKSNDDVIRGLFYMNAAEKVFGISRGGIIECYPVYEYFKLDVHNRALSNSYKQPIAKQVNRGST